MKEGDKMLTDVITIQQVSNGFIIDYMERKIVAKGIDEIFTVLKDLLKTKEAIDFLKKTYRIEDKDYDEELFPM